MTEEKLDELFDAVRNGIYGDDRMSRYDLNAALDALSEIRVQLECLLAFRSTVKELVSISESAPPLSGVNS